MKKEYKSDWSIIKEAITDNWFESNPDINHSEIDEMAIGVAGVVDKVVNKFISSNLLTNFKIYTMKELDELKIVQLKEIESYFWNYRLKIKSVLEYKQAMENEE